MCVHVCVDMCVVHTQTGSSCMVLNDNHHLVCISGVTCIAFKVVLLRPGDGHSLLNVGHLYINQVASF